MDAAEKKDPFDTEGLERTSLRGRRSSRDGSPKPDVAISSGGDSARSAPASSGHNGRRGQSGSDLPEITENRFPIVPGPGEVLRHFNQEAFNILMDVVPNSREIMAKWRSNRGRFGHACLNLLRTMTDGAVNCVFLGDYTKAEKVEQELELMFTEVVEGRLPGYMVEHLPHPEHALMDDFFMRRVRQSFVQEIAEIRIVRLWWPYITGEVSSLPKIPTLSASRTTIEGYFKALSDAISEISKMVNILEEDPDLSTDDRIAIHERYLGVARAMMQRRDNDQSEAAAVLNGKWWNGTSRWSRRVIGYSEQRLRELRDLKRLRSDLQL